MIHGHLNYTPNSTTLTDVTLRCGQDVKVFEGVTCLMVQDQQNPDWSPKSEAGERAVPVHTTLVRAGLLDLVAARQDEVRLVPGTRHTGPDQKLGAEFSRQFSKRKTDLGVGGKTTFHSFRASVRTILGNQAANIRETWIDAVLGHETQAAKGVGAAVYLKNICVQNLRATVEGIAYPAAVMEAFDALVALCPAPMPTTPAV